MDFWKALMDVNFWIRLIQQFTNLGPLGPILLAASESIFSFLPFIAIVAFHVGLYGEVLGFLYSWIGTTLGSIFVFSTIRFCSDHMPYIQNFSIIRKLRHMLSRQDTMDLFLITACPFMPSFLINISYGISDFDKKVFIQTIIASKSIMVLSLVLFGSSIKKAFDQPEYLIFALLLFIALYFLSHIIKKKLPR